MLLLGVTPRLQRHAGQAGLPRFLSGRGGRRLRPLPTPAVGARAILLRVRPRPPKTAEAAAWVPLRAGLSQRSEDTPTKPQRKTKIEIREGGGNARNGRGFQRGGPRPPLRPQGRIGKRDAPVLEDGEVFPCDISIIADRRSSTCGRYGQASRPRPRDAASQTTRDRHTMGGMPPFKTQRPCQRHLSSALVGSDLNSLLFSLSSRVLARLPLSREKGEN